MNTSFKNRDKVVVGPRSNSAIHPLVNAFEPVKTFVQMKNIPLKNREEVLIGPLEHFASNTSIHRLADPFGQIKTMGHKNGSWKNHAEDAVASLEHSRSCSSGHLLSHRFGSIKTGVNKKNAFSSNCAQTAYEPIEHFGVNTSFHGCKYVLEPKRRLLERCIWLLTVTLCAIGAGVLVYTSLEKFYNNPTVTSILSLTNQTSELPFPAITFCNVNLVFEYKANRLVETLNIPNDINMSRERLREIIPYVAIFLRPRIPLDERLLDDFVTLQQILDANNMSTWSVLEKLSQSCSEMLERCTWNGVMRNCEDIFDTSTSLNGYCCSFNQDYFSNWTGHPDRDPYGLKTDHYGLGTGLQVLLNPMKEDYLWGSYLASGFSVTVHRSGLYPQGEWVFIGESETYLRISPDFTDGDTNLKAVDPERRGCIFYDERPLITSGTYSIDACSLECRAQTVESLCGCVPFYFVEQGANSRESNVEKAVDNFQAQFLNISLRYCNLKHIRCLWKHIDEIEPESSLDHCNCAPQCTILDYVVSVTYSNFEAVDYFVGDFYEGINTTGRVSVNVYFDSQVADHTSKNIIYTVTQLMSNLGGIFSLFLGCSFLSALEILYYTVLRAPRIYGNFCKGSH